MRYNKYLRKAVPHPVVTVVLWLVWLLLNNTIAAGHIVLGLVLAITIPLLTAGFWSEKIRLREPLLLLQFLSLVLWDIAIANLVVAKLILAPNKNLQPAFFTIELDIQTPLGVSLLSNTISLTPGTVSCDLSADRRQLLVHALHVEDIAATIKKIKQRYEAPLKKVFTPC